MKLSTADVEQQIISIVQQLLIESGGEYSQRRVTLNSSLQQHLGIDSLGRAELFQRIEACFHISLPENLIAEADTLNDLVNAIITAAPARKNEYHGKIKPALEKSLIDPLQAKTLLDVLFLYATDDAERPHIYLITENNQEEVITYGKLLENSLRVANALLKRGIKPGETIAIMQPTNPGFFYTFFGALLINCVPVPIYPPFRPNQIEAYAKQEAKILQNAEVRILVTFHEAENLSKLLRTFIPSLREVTTVNALLKEEEKAPIIEVQPNDLAMIQYTSGSTSAPKGVSLTHENLLANIRAYGEAINISSDDVAVSWVPLYHDLGLIGMWLGSLYHGIPLVLMSPLLFLNHPEKWLWAIHYHRGTISGGPNFAYELCIRKVDPAQIEGLDLSSWRIAFNGAEPIQPKTLTRFTEKFASYGFKSKTHLPVYGLAESSVCVAISPLNRGVRIDKIDRKAFEEKKLAIPSAEQHSLEFVACGIPIPRHEVRIVDENNEALPERHVGQLQFKGPSSMQGYYNNPEATLAIYHDGWWGTGDLAYVADGEIFITGRKKDMIIKAGRNLYPAEIEDLAAQQPDIRKGCVIAFGTVDAERGTEKLIVVAETREKRPAHPEKIRSEINKNLTTALDIAPDHIVLVPPQTIPKTSSGKLQRAACKASYVSGTLYKKRVPFWLQITRLGITSVLAKTKQLLANTARFIYTCYGIALLGITLAPIYACLWLFPRKYAAYICKAWARILFFCMFCPIEVHGKEYLKQPRLIYAANHASYIDGLMLLGILPVGTRFTGKKELMNFWLTRHFMQKLGFVGINRTDLPQGLEDTKQMELLTREGNSLLIFPEGTFGYATGLRPFKLGGFKIAAETNTAICPAAIKGTRYILRDEERLFRPGKISITLCEPIFSSGTAWQDITLLKNKVREKISDHCGEPCLGTIISSIAQ